MRKQIIDFQLKYFKCEQTSCTLKINKRFRRDKRFQIIFISTTNVAMTNIVRRLIEPWWYSVVIIITINYYLDVWSFWTISELSLKISSNIVHVKISGIRLWTPFESTLKNLFFNKNKLYQIKIRTKYIWIQHWDYQIFIY